MTVTNDNFKVKNGLDVAGDANFGSNIILGNTPLAFDSTSNRLKIYVNNSWKTIATFDDIVTDLTNQINFMDIGLSIDYNGLPTYIVQGNGVSPAGTSKFLDGGNPSTTTLDYIFDSGIIV